MKSTLTGWGLVAFLALAAAGSSGGAPQRSSEPLPFHLQDLQRRAAAVARSAESLATLLEGRREGRLREDEFRTYFRERSKFLKDLTKDIEWHGGVNQLHQLKRSVGSTKLENPRRPESLADAGPLIQQLIGDAKMLQDQAEHIGEDYTHPEVNVEEFSQPSPRALCKRIRKSADYLADLAENAP